MTIGVYGIINKVNNLPYVGESNNIERRWDEHVDDLNNNSHCNYKLQTAWNTYGKDNFTFEILEEIQKIDNNHYKTIMQLIYLEGKYIDQYDSINKGYNIENTIEEVLSGRKIITSGSIDRKYLARLINNNGLNAKVNKFPSLTNTYSELKKEGYVLKSPTQELLLKGVIKEYNDKYYIKEELIEDGYFINGKSRPKDKFKYYVFVTTKGKQFIIDTLELKNNKIKQKTN